MREEGHSPVSGFQTCKESPGMREEEHSPVSGFQASEETESLRFSLVA